MQRAVAAGVAGVMAVVAAACATGPGVRTEQAALLTPTTSVPTVPVPSEADWTECPGIDVYELLTDWECAWVAVPLDRADPTSAHVEVALTRPVLDASDRRRPLVVEPGGPGASGVEFAWTFVDMLPPDLLDEFYPVGWDPRASASPSRRSTAARSAPPGYRTSTSASSARGSC